VAALDRLSGAGEVLPSRAEQRGVVMSCAQREDLSRAVVAVSGYYSGSATATIAGRRTLPL